MISSGRYNYHQQDIAEIKAESKPLHPVMQLNLNRMIAEVLEYEKHHSIEPSALADSGSETQDDHVVSTQ